MSDGSIYTEMKSETGYERVYDDGYSVEMVTPKLTYAELPKLQECVRQVRHAGAKVNNTCGIHVHVDAANHNRQSLKNLLSIMYSKEDILFKALQVNPNRVIHYCKRFVNPCWRKHESSPQMKRKISQRWRASGMRGMCRAVSIITGPVTMR